MANRLLVKGSTIKVGDTIKVHYVFKEGEKEKRQTFEGIVLSVSGMNENKMFTVRKMTKSKVGVERIFPIHSPFIEKVDIVKHSLARKAKLYYVRTMSDKAIRERVSA